MAFFCLHSSSASGRSVGSMRMAWRLERLSSSALRMAISTFSADMVTMAAEKVEMAILKAEEESLSSLQAILMEPTLRPEALDEWRQKNAIFSSLTVVDRQ